MPFYEHAKSVCCNIKYIVTYDTYFKIQENSLAKLICTCADINDVLTNAQRRI